MRLLLDTCTLLWTWAEPHKLSERVQRLLVDPHHKVWVSAASAWEIATQHRRGNYPAGRHVIDEWEDRLAQDGFRQLAIASVHALRAGSLPHSHRDPFDRMIAAQAMVQKIKVATPDPALRALGADTIW
ncbi:MAG: type II toxin-antitoxin system VapC family toxin [Spirochaetaceae bacterium]|nr:type II toxin-antitoxin system VapC family toxin [Spirochaetaceae bacterium]